jgi:flavin-dependent dehydrogenase
MDGKGLPWQGTAFYSHLLPSLGTAAWGRNRVAGDGWLAVGDAAGLVDPITGEGLYYAMRSADLAAGSLLSPHARMAERVQHYRLNLRRDFMADLEMASRLARRFFLGRFLFGSVTQRVIDFTARSPRFAAIMQDMFAGTQPYRGLKGRLLRNLGGSLYDILLSLNRAVQSTKR